MSTILSEFQKNDLHKSIVDYLHSSGYAKTCQQFKDEDPKLADFNPDPTSKTAGILVKKWTSIIRLQKKILDLEARLAQALEESSHTSTVSTGNKRTNPDWLPTSGARHNLTGHRNVVTAVAFHPVYSSLVSASEDTTLRVWDWESGELERTLKGHTRHVTDCQYDSKGKFLVSSSYDLFVKLWDVENNYQNTTTFRGHEHSVSSAGFMPGDTQVISSSRDASVRIWEISTGHCVKVFHPHSSWIRRAISSSDGRRIVTCSMDHTACVIDSETGAVKTELRGHENVVEAVVFVPVNAVAAVRDLTSIKSPPEADTASFSYVVTGSRDKTVKLWDAIRGQCLWTFVGHDNWIRAIIFHPAGKHLISAADDNTYRIWDLKTGRCVRRIEAHERFVSCIAWGRQALSVHDAEAKGTEVARVVNVIATGSSDQTVKIWLP
ncbi:dynein regulator [Mycena floridula]|nr:dynein regulator [Mycena floridula]